MDWFLGGLWWIVQALLMVGVGMTLLVVHLVLVHWIFQGLCRWFRL